MKILSKSNQRTSLWPCSQRVHIGLRSSHLIFFDRQVKQPFLERVYLGLLREPPVPEGGASGSFADESAMSETLFELVGWTAAACMMAEVGS